jgi:hypothetical protein
MIGILVITSLDSLYNEDPSLHFPFTVVLEKQSQAKIFIGARYRSIHTV